MPRAARRARTAPLPTREGQRTTDEPEKGHPSWHEAGPVHQVAQQQSVPKASTELRPEQKRPVMERDQRLTGDGQGGGVAPAARDVLPQHDNRQEADEADEDERGFNDPKAT